MTLRSSDLKSDSDLDFIRNSNKQRFDLGMTTHKQSLCLFQVAGKDRMSQYSVSRISRLVDMYHGLHAALDKEGFGNEENESEAEGSRRFSCPTCKRRNWSSIETFRTHKLACR